MFHPYLEEPTAPNETGTPNTTLFGNTTANVLDAEVGQRSGSEDWETLYNYSCSQGNLIFPLINEYTWRTGVRAFLYLAAMLWCFLAVAVVADIFMASIERIVSTTRTVRVLDTTKENMYREVKVKIWNESVAILSLLAFGTSAPEILLSVFEIIWNDFRAGELGPGTIVGSASFNLLFITAVCVSAIPEGKVSRIENYKVFILTTITCVGAYIWVVFVLLVHTPHVVDVSEAITTLAFFPLLLVTAWVIDSDIFVKETKFKQKKVDPRLKAEALLHPEIKMIKEEGTPTDSPQKLPSGSKRSAHFSQLSVLAQTVAEEAAFFDEETDFCLDDTMAEEVLLLARDLCFADEVSIEKASTILAQRINSSKSHGMAWHRIGAIREISGGKKLTPISMNLDYAKHVEDTRKSIINNYTEVQGKINLSIVQFTAVSMAVMENVGKCRLRIKRTGKMDSRISVIVETINGTAKAYDDYKPMCETVEFAPMEDLKEIAIEIVDDFQWEPDEMFYVKLRVDDDSPEPCIIGNNEICEVTIVNDDEPGVLSFEKNSYVVKETEPEAIIPVVRTDGADGVVTVKWSSKNITAIAGLDYCGMPGELSFETDETTKNIVIPIYQSDYRQRSDTFQVELSEPTEGATLGKITKAVVTIICDEDFYSTVMKMLNMTKANLDKLDYYKTSYGQQFIHAMNVNGGDIEHATVVDYVLHFLTFFWKVLFAFIPPAQYGGGWPAFVISLAAIGFLTAIIGDMASVLGCLINLDNTITALILIAMGTSMPDLFASRSAAIMEKTADSSIGNVTGSNSVNVFLGLGLPWLIASVYWYFQGKQFKVPAGSIGFSVVVYAICAAIALIILVLRRNSASIGGELGGPKGIKYATSFFFVFLWLAFIVLSILQIKGKIG